VQQHQPRHVGLRECGHRLGDLIDGVCARGHDDRLARRRELAEEGEVALGVRRVGQSESLRFSSHRVT
jgi:hypothetical protein